MVSKTLDFKSVATKPVAAWVAELGLIDPSDITFSEGTMKAEKLAGLTSWSNDLDIAAAIAFMPVLSDLFGEQLTLKEDQAAIMGDGTSTYGGFTGLINLSGINSYTLSTGKTLTADLDFDEVREAAYVPSKIRRVGAQWLFPERVVKQLLSIKDGMGRYIIGDPTNPLAVSSVFGYSLVDPEGVHDSLFPADAAGAAIGVFGNFARALFGTMAGLSVTTSTDAVISTSAGVVSLNAYQQDATLMRLLETIGFGYPQHDAFTVLKTSLT
jgi:HK97 family phage major capsid protein